MSTHPESDSINIFYVAVICQLYSIAPIDILIPKDDLIVYETQLCNKYNKCIQYIANYIITNCFQLEFNLNIICSNQSNIEYNHSYEVNFERIHLFDHWYDAHTYGKYMLQLIQTNNNSILERNEGTDETGDNISYKNRNNYCFLKMSFKFMDISKISSNTVDRYESSWINSKSMEYVQNILESQNMDMGCGFKWFYNRGNRKNKNITTATSGSMWDAHVTLQYFGCKDPDGSAIFLYNPNVAQDIDKKKEFSQLLVHSNAAYWLRGAMCSGICSGRADCMVNDISMLYHLPSISCIGSRIGLLFSNSMSLSLLPVALTQMHNMSKHPHLLPVGVRVEIGHERKKSLIDFDETVRESFVSPASIPVTVYIINDTEMGSDDDSRWKMDMSTWGCQSTKTHTPCDYLENLLMLCDPNHRKGIRLLLPVGFAFDATNMPASSDSDYRWLRDKDVAVSDDGPSHMAEPLSSNSIDASTESGADKCSKGVSMCRELNSHCFTDGSGFISPDILCRLGLEGEVGISKGKVRLDPRQTQSFDSTPTSEGLPRSGLHHPNCCVQVRLFNASYLGVVKGTLVTNKYLPVGTVIIRKSMIKVRPPSASCSLHCTHISPISEHFKKHLFVEVLNSTTVPKTLRQQNCTQLHHMVCSVGNNCTDVRTKHKESSLNRNACMSRMTVSGHLNKQLLLLLLPIDVDASTRELSVEILKKKFRFQIDMVINLVQNVTNIEVDSVLMPISTSNYENTARETWVYPVRVFMDFMEIHGYVNGNVVQQKSPSCPVPTSLLISETMSMAASGINADMNELCALYYAFKSLFHSFDQSSNPEESFQSIHALYSDPYVQALLLRLQQRELQSIVDLKLWVSTRSRPITDNSSVHGASGYFMGIPDPFMGLLDWNEVYIWVNIPGDRAAINAKLFEGGQSVLIVKYPITHHHHVQRFVVVNDTGSVKCKVFDDYFKDTVGSVCVFSTQPPPCEVHEGIKENAVGVGALGGDYDGDMYFVCGDVDVLEIYESSHENKGSTCIASNYSDVAAGNIYDFQFSDVNSPVSQTPKVNSTVESCAIERMDSNCTQENSSINQLQFASLLTSEGIAGKEAVQFSFSIPQSPGMELSSNVFSCADKKQVEMNPSTGSGPDFDTLNSIASSPTALMDKLELRACEVAESSDSLQQNDDPHGNGRATSPRAPSAISPIEMEKSLFLECIRSTRILSDIGRISNLWLACLDRMSASRGCNKPNSKCAIPYRELYECYATLYTSLLQGRKTGFVGLESLETKIRKLLSGMEIVYPHYMQNNNTTSDNAIKTNGYKTKVQHKCVGLKLSAHKHYHSSSVCGLLYDMGTHCIELMPIITPPTSTLKIGKPDDGTKYRITSPFDCSCNHYRDLSDKYKNHFSPSIGDLLLILHRCKQLPAPRYPHIDCFNCRTLNAYFQSHKILFYDWASVILTHFQYNSTGTSRSIECSSGAGQQAGGRTKRKMKSYSNCSQSTAESHVTCRKWSFCDLVTRHAAHILLGPKREQGIDYMDVSSPLEQLSVEQFKTSIRLAIATCVGVRLEMMHESVGDGVDGDKETIGRVVAADGLCESLRILPMPPIIDVDVSSECKNMNKTKKLNPGHLGFELASYYCDVLECCVIQALFDICYYKADNYMLTQPQGIRYGPVISSDCVLSPLRICWWFYGPLYLDMLIALGK